MPIPYNGKIIPHAKHLRTNATRHEKQLWYDFLAKYPIRFQRQKSIGNYIADFYCHAAKLIIELDGSQHYTPTAISHDQARTATLQKYGILVLRFTNKDIDKCFEQVCLKIDKTVRERI